MNKEYTGQCMAIAHEPLKAGATVVICGYKTVYAGELLKPRTWLKFTRIAVVKNAR